MGVESKGAASGKLYAVTGVSGQVGGATARTLLAAGARVRVIVRDESKGKEWKAKGCEVAIADWNSAEALTAALKGTDGAYVMLPSNWAPAQGYPEAKAIIAALHTAIAEARPARVVVLSTIGAESTKPSLLIQLHLLEEGLRDLPGQIAFVRAAYFMENFRMDVAAAREGVIPTFLQPIDRAFPMIATADVGRLAAETLLQREWSGDRVRIIELEGPRRYSAADEAAAFASILHHDVVAKPVPRSEWETRLRAMGSPNPTAFIQMMDGFNEGWIRFERQSDTVKGHIPLEEFLPGLVPADSKELRKELHKGLHKEPLQEPLKEPHKEAKA